MSSAPALTVLAWSEDSAKRAHEVVALLAKRMFTLVDDQCRTNLVRFEPLTAQGAEQLKGAVWKSKKSSDRPSRVQLLRTVADALVREDGFVLVHLDGDTAWARRTTTPLPADVEEHLRGPVRQLLTQLKDGKKPTLDVESCLSRLLLLVPYYSIEAWLFQHTSEARKLCCGRHHPSIGEWERDRTLLDELEDPKEALPCLLSKTEAHSTLAGNGFPAPQVYAAGKSYAAAVNTLKECPALVTAIERTWNPDAG